MPRDEQELDPYAPPPRHKERSGPLVRVVLIAAMLGLGYWGYTEYSDQSAPSLVAEEQTQQVADASNPDGSYSVIETPAPPAAEPAAAAPAPSAPQTSAPAPVTDVPPPSTTIGTPGR